MMILPCRNSNQKTKKKQWFFSANRPELIETKLWKNDHTICVCVFYQKIWQFLKKMSSLKNSIQFNSIDRWGWYFAGQSSIVTHTNYFSQMLQFPFIFLSKLFQFFFVNIHPLFEYSDDNCCHRRRPMCLIDWLIIIFLGFRHHWQDGFDDQKKKFFHFQFRSIGTNQSQRCFVLLVILVSSWNWFWKLILLFG